MGLRLLLMAALAAAGVALAYGLSVIERHFTKRAPLEFELPSEKRAKQQ
ncbi:MAG: hypothetical protein KDJ90_01455 [Nitratireductor sp.]|nr:hypothetical protein [Nitratireductor sp.]